MIALLQRVTSGKVTINQETVGEISAGLVIFAGVAGDDTPADIARLCDKIVNLRIFSDENGKLNLSALDVGAEMLVVSQFTLLADMRKGRRPSFERAAPPQQAESLFEEFVNMLQKTNLKVETGRFRQHMLVQIENDGPVTIYLNSREL